MTIVPETKDWTWVLQQQCPECRFDASIVEYDAIPDLLRANAGQWPAVLERDDVRVRPNESTWSPLEYAAHVRDVFRLFPQRLQLILDEDEPTFAFWDQDATAVEDCYNEQDPATVAAELLSAADAAAQSFAAVEADRRTRAGLRNGDGAVFTVESLARYFVHDPIHHIHDVTSS